MPYKRRNLRLILLNFYCDPCLESRTLCLDVSNPERLDRPRRDAEESLPTPSRTIRSIGRGRPLLSPGPAGGRRRALRRRPRVLRQGGRSGAPAPRRAPAAREDLRQGASTISRPPSPATGRSSRSPATTAPIPTASPRARRSTRLVQKAEVAASRATALDRRASRGIAPGILRRPAPDHRPIAAARVRSPPASRSTRQRPSETSASRPNRQVEREEDAADARRARGLDRRCDCAPGRSKGATS